MSLELAYRKVTAIAEFSDRIREAFDRLNNGLYEAKAKGWRYTPAIHTAEFSVFDVIQPPDDCKNDGTDMRKELESEVLTTTDYILRDRIYCIPQYLHLCVYKPEFDRTSFNRLKQELIQSNDFKIYERSLPEEEPDSLTPTLTRWAASNGYNRVQPGERQLDFATMETLSGYVHLKLVGTDSNKEGAFLALTLDNYAGKMEPLEALLDLEKAALEVIKLI